MAVKATDLMKRGMPALLAQKVVAQIAAGTGNRLALMRGGMPVQQAVVLAAAITTVGAATGLSAKLRGYGMHRRLADLVATAEAGG